MSVSVSKVTLKSSSLCKNDGPIGYLTLGLVATISLDLRLNSVTSCPPCVELLNGNILVEATGNVIKCIYVVLRIYLYI